MIKKIFYSDKIFDFINVLVMTIILLIIAYPLWFVIIASFSSAMEIHSGNVILLPKGFSLDAYIEMFNHQEIFKGYRNSLFYTVVGTTLNLVMTVLCAYPLSCKDFLPRKVLQYFFMFTMYFGGGLIPTYLIVRKLGLVNSMWTMIVLGAMSVYNMLIMRSYFMNSIPGELEEASILDGANKGQYLVKVVLPLSKPIIAVLLLYYALGHWNDFYTALVYISNNELVPLQTVLKRLLLDPRTTNQFQGMSPQEVYERSLLFEKLKYSTIIVASIPMLIIYPFVQKHFVKGVMIGAIKG